MKMKCTNYITLEFLSHSANEGFARGAVACFAAQLDPTLEELGDIKTAVSEAVLMSPSSSRVGSSWAAKQATAPRAKASLALRLRNSRAM